MEEVRLELGIAIKIYRWRGAGTPNEMHKF